MRWKTILVPHDFSTSAHHAAAIARDEAVLHGAAIVLLHVVDLPHQFSPDTVVVPDAAGAPISLKLYALRSAEAHLQELAAKLDGSGVAATGSVVVGSPVDEIHRAVDQHGADLIVMGTHGRTGVRRLIAGSVAERVVRGSKVPVLIVRHPDGDPK